MSFVRNDNLKEKGTDISVLRDAKKRELFFEQGLLEDLSDEIIRGQEDAVGS